MKTTHADTLLTPVRFFFRYAGWSYDPAKETKQAGRWRCARALADAEAYAKDHGFSFQWEIDETCDSSEWEHEGEPYAVWSCLARDAEGNVIGSLGGIDFGRDGEPWGDTYRRVVEAELASEASTATAVTR
jgi:hypothetical protein